VSNAALRIIILVPVIAQVIIGAARLLRSGLSGTCRLCHLRAMRTAVLGGSLPYRLDGEPPLIGMRAQLQGPAAGVLFLWS